MLDVENFAKLFGTGMEMLQVSEIPNIPCWYLYLHEPNKIEVKPPKSAASLFGNVK